VPGGDLHAGALRLQRLPLLRARTVRQVQLPGSKFGVHFLALPIVRQRQERGETRCQVCGDKIVKVEKKRARISLNRICCRKFRTVKNCNLFSTKSICTFYNIHE
jgi:hypothetical protein